ncbi:MAG: jacalin-like lectin [Cyanobacteriota bacterium]|nr:hypothetical protein [Cyanobium sp. 49614_E6]
MPLNDPTAGYLGFGVSRVHDQLDQLNENPSPRPSRSVDGEAIAGGLGGGSRCSICRTAGELAQAMQNESGGSLTGLGFLPLLSGKMAFYHSLKTTIYSLSVVAHAWRITAAARLSQPHLAAGVHAPTTEAELEKFVRFYGDSYISSVELGGECFGVYTFRSETREQAEGVELALKVGGLVSGLQVGADLHHKLETASRSSGISFDFQGHVWGCSDFPGLTPENLVPFALGFGERAVIDRPILMDLATEGYEVVPDMDNAFQPVKHNRDLFTGPEGLLRQRQRIQELINQLDDIRLTLAAYGISLLDANELSVNKALAKADLTTLDQLVKDYEAKPAAPLQLPKLQSLDVGSPKIRAKVREEPSTRIGKMDKGQPFPFPFDRAKALQNRVRLVGIGLEAGWRVDKLRLRYGSKLGGEAVQEVRHGGERRTNLGDINFDEGEGIRGIYSEFGTNIDLLRFETDQGNLESTGTKGDKQHPVDWHPGPGQVVLGFSGRSDDNPDGAVYALQAVVASIEGIDWLPIDHVDLEDG